MKSDGLLDVWLSQINTIAKLEALLVHTAPCSATHLHPLLPSISCSFLVQFLSVLLVPFGEFIFLFFSENFFRLVWAVGQHIIGPSEGASRTPHFNRPFATFLAWMRHQLYLFGWRNRTQSVRQRFDGRSNHRVDFRSLGGAQTAAAHTLLRLI